MNITMTKDEFHELIMVYLISLSRSEKGILKEGDVVHSPDFDNFLLHIQSKPLGDLKLAYAKLPPKTKTQLKRFMATIDNKDSVSILL